MNTQPACTKNAQKTFTKARADAHGQDVGLESPWLGCGAGITMARHVGLDWDSFRG